MKNVVGAFIDMGTWWKLSGGKYFFIFSGYHCCTYNNFILAHSLVLASFSQILVEFTKCINYIHSSITFLVKRINTTVTICATCHVDFTGKEFFVIYGNKFFPCVSYNFVEITMFHFLTCIFHS